MINDRQLEVLINDVYEYHGFDFGGYSRASLKRRVDRLVQLDGFKDFAAFLSKVRSEPAYFKHMVEEITVNVTEMFRDPHFYKTLREEIIPTLAPKPFIRIWHAGCSSGEEVFSMAILLQEANLLHKSLLYATDINPLVLETARKAIFPLRMMKAYSENYMASGGKKDFSEYYTANYGFAKFDEHFVSKMVFSQHNLVSDGSFNEFDLIMCRNVLIYFDKDLQERALQLFDNSLSKLGYLALGTKETIKFSKMEDGYEQHKKEKLWKKIK
ncbi:protein-glutamate O-methyltransferase CheR [Flavobacterium sp. Sd200]|uniref:CheR family methyltransferase n=1 Tax=Flavobacterium sp. Sd200 TaxID=2692211 RepID=UPI00136A9BF3|nr:protein-glutamate O-methyltransferase CheR [Flavobacterium sp. Sd200]MXN90421.1 protein-glutamate O-methyltransferase CheR [Flavobacterium sp. Sd200]